ncbi:hypothetical protein [Arabiibacter massiliensis]|uniref:hypothetical protein n=1 Tax=Arabiibacter massiliensis TaxID=1870985 RepID=UPI0009B9E648|nr:hypothetical protein [Arabiibacter massiliensis]
MCDGLRTSKFQVQSASGIVSALVNCGALARTVLVDGEPYDGSVEDFQQDDGIPEGAEALFLLQTTSVGEGAAARVAESLSLESIIASCPHRAPAFQLVLALCAGAAGKTTSALQDALKRENMLETDPARGIDGLHASYFTGALEHIGALAWNGGTWITSEKGLAILDRA